MKKVIKLPKELIPKLLGAYGIDPKNNSLEFGIVEKVYLTKKCTWGDVLSLAGDDEDARKVLEEKLMSLNEKGIIEWTTRKNLVYVKLTESAMWKYHQLQVGVPTAELLEETKKELFKLLDRTNAQLKEKGNISKKWIVNGLRSMADNLDNKTKKES